MALLTSEIQRIKAELGFSLLTSAAAPWVNVSAYFEQVVASYLQAGASTTSSTTVTAADTPTPVAITLASATGFATGARVWVDVDDRMESATIQSLSGAVATLALSNAHSGTYKVEVDGGEAVVREVLANIKRTKSELAGTFGEGALKKVDEVEFYDTGTVLFGSTAKALMYWRDELAQLLGTVNMFRQKRAAGSTIALY